MLILYIVIITALHDKITILSLVWRHLPPLNISYLLLNPILSFHEIELPKTAQIFGFGWWMVVRINRKSSIYAFLSTIIIFIEKGILFCNVCYWRSYSIILDIHLSVSSVFLREMIFLCLKCFRQRSDFFGLIPLIYEHIFYTFHCPAFFRLCNMKQYLIVSTCFLN